MSDEDYLIDQNLFYAFTNKPCTRDTCLKNREKHVDLVTDIPIDHAGDLTVDRWRWLCASR